MAEREEPRVPGTRDHQRDTERRFAALYQAYYRPILAYAVRRAAPGEDAADIVADVFTTAWRRIGELPEPPADRLWLYGVAQRVLAGRRRPARRLGLNAGSTARRRAALYRVIESLPGVANLGPVTDRLGRHGQAVGLVTSGTRDELIFDPASTVVLEEETVAVAPRQSGNNMLPPGTVLQYTVYLREGVVNSDTGLPRAVSGTPSPSPSAVSASPSPTAGG
jgi:hypothetical protein